MSRGPSRPGVVLVAHGSARSGASAEPTLALAEALRSRGFPEVRTAFWKEETFLHQALDLTRGRTVAVLPVFLAEGYFTRTVVPRELDLRYGENARNGRTLHLLPPVGLHAGMAELVRDRAGSALSPEERSDALLIVLGHGTPRDPGSGDTTRAIAAALGARAEFARVEPAFIDQEPRVERVLENPPEARAVVVPYLISAGFHGGDTVPADLARVEGIPVTYAEPVGTHPGMVDLVEAMLAGVPGEDGEDPDAPLARATTALEARLARGLAEGRPLRLLQALVRRRPAGWEIRHVDDAAAADSTLWAIGGLHALETLARRSEGGAHRPLRTSADLRRGWTFTAHGGRAAAEALVALYGAAFVHWAEGELPTTSFEEMAARQTGMYAALKEAEPSVAQGCIDRVCDGLPCLRSRLWTIDGSRVDPARGSDPVPCPRPCPILLSAALEATRPGGVDGPGGLG